MQTYFIIGASSGIGRQLAQRLAEAGHQVYATYHQHAQDSTERIHYHHLNVLEETIGTDFLPEAIDGLVYCPGSIQLRPFHRIGPESFAGDFSLNVVGAVKVIQAALPRLRNGVNPSIILFSSIAATLGLNFHTQVSTSKAAVEGLARALAAELAPRIRVNCIAPSITDTPLAASLLNTGEKKEASAQRHPLKRVGSTDDIAAMAQFLLSEQSSWMTGQVIHVDGGMSAIKM